MAVIRHGDERIYGKEHYNCSFCDRTVERGAIWVGPDISLCQSCLLSGNGADIMGRILGDAIYAVYDGRSYTVEVETITKQIEASIYRILYNHARRRMKAAG